MTRHSVQTLRDVGKTQRETAEATGASERTVRRIDKEPTVTSSDDAATRKARGIGRPSALTSEFVEVAAKLLEEDREMFGVEILRRLRKRGYTGSKSALYRRLKTLRPAKEARPIVRFEGAVGEFCQHDFGQTKVRYDGAADETVVIFFASRLKYSRFTAVSVVPNEQSETLCRTWAAHLESFGGLPLTSVFDRPKTVAIEWKKNGVITKYNATFGAAKIELNMDVRVCWPYRGQEKGSVENLVGWVKGSFFKQRRFIDEEDLLAQLVEWLHETNHDRENRATEKIPAVLLKEEQAHFRPIHCRAHDLAFRQPVVVNSSGYVLHKTNLYSMPPSALHRAGTLYVYEDRLRIVAGDVSAEHARVTGRRQTVTLPEHRATRVGAQPGHDAKLYTKRQHIMDLGRPAVLFVTHLVHNRRLTWEDDVNTLHDLLSKHGDEDFANALASIEEPLRCNAFVVRQILEARPSAARRGAPPAWNMGTDEDSVPDGLPI